MVRVGEGGGYVEKFLNDGWVALGWRIRPITETDSDTAIETLFAETYQELQPMCLRRGRSAEVRARTSAKVGP